MVEDLLVLDWRDDAAHMINRSLHPEKIVYAPQVKSVMNQLSALEGEAREAYVEQQRCIVLDTLNVPDQTTPNPASLIMLPFSVHQKIQRLGDEAPR